MKTKCVYVLVSNERDSYYEQMLCSVYSLKLHNPQSTVLIVVDDGTAQSLVEKRSEIRRYVSDIVSIDVPKEFTQMQKSRYLKTNLRKYIEGDFLFIDTDTIIHSNLNDVDNFDYEITAVPDAHVNIGQHKVKKGIYEWAKIGEWEVREDKPYFNSGVMYVKDTPMTHCFYEKWYYYWFKNYKKGLYKDQSSLAKADESMGYVIKEMNAAWNCQFIDNGLKYMQDAKILHYYASRSKSPFLFGQKNFYSSIKENGKITEEISYMLKNPTLAFLDDCVIMTGSDKDLLINIFRRVFSQDYPRAYKIIHKIKHPFS